MNSNLNTQDDALTDQEAVENLHYFLNKSVYRLKKPRSNSTTKIKSCKIKKIGV